MIAHINIGSNLGHRAELLARAVSMLDPMVGRVVAVSAPVESEAWGYESANRFLNVGVNVDTALAPREIIGRLQQIEQTIDRGGAHRNADGSYRDRKIDLDLICLDATVSTDPAATLPHPRMASRSFVLEPMAEILPDWCHPILLKSPQQLLVEEINART